MSTDKTDRDEAVRIAKAEVEAGIADQNAGAIAGLAKSKQPPLEQEAIDTPYPHEDGDENAQPV